MRSRTTVILATYNGAKFVVDQLKSIERVVEGRTNILICDDCSTDNTLHILGNFASESRHNVQIYLNESNLGPSKTFHKLLSMVETEFVVFCDQDDIWICDRVAETEKLSNEILISRMEVIGDVSNANGFSAPIAKPSVLYGLLFPCFPGCCLSGKTDVIRTLLSYKNYKSMYDWILVSRAVIRQQPFRFTDSVCILYRRHDQTVTKMGVMPDGILIAMKRRMQLLIDLVF